MADRRPIEFSAQRRIGRAPDRVFIVLADLRSHWPLLGGVLAEAEMLDGERGERARLAVRMPPPLGWLGARRIVDTEVLELRAPELLRGRAVAGASSALIEWRVAEQRGGRATGSHVRFSAVIAPGSVFDSMLLRLARPWLARQGRRVLARLDAEVIALDAPPAAEPAEGTVS